MLIPALLALLTLLCPSHSQIYNFDYSDHGANWADKAPEGTDWSKCSSQNQQSPIELAAKTSQHDSFLFVNFYPQKGLIYWYNTTVYIRTSIITTSFGEVYSQTAEGHLPALRATEVRIRAHAQHKFEGQDYYDLELQIFCTDLYGSPKNQKLAIGFMFQVGEQPDPALEVIKNNFIQGNDTVPFPSINATLSFSHLLTNSEPFDYYFYQGSSTIPPCFVGGLNWVIPKRVYSMSQAQRDFFWQLFNDQGSRVGNWRALQPLNDNPVYLKQQ